VYEFADGFYSCVDAKMNPYNNDLYIDLTPTLDDLESLSLLPSILANGQKN
jgi:hypothetical protein